MGKTRDLARLNKKLQQFRDRYGWRIPPKFSRKQ
jgi:hypothetical protein